MNHIFKQYNQMGEDIYFHHVRTDEVRQAYSMRIPPESHRQIELFYLIEGDVIYDIEGERYPVKAGDMLFVAPYHIHSLIVDLKDHAYERKVLLFDDGLLSRLLAGNPALDGIMRAWHGNLSPVIPRCVVAETDLPQVFHSIFDSDDGEYGELMLFSRLLHVIVELDRIFSNRAFCLRDPTVTDQLIRNVAAYVSENLIGELSLDDIAAHFFVSKSTLCHRFKEHMDISLNRYIALKRIYRAAEYIHNGMSAKEAAHAVGYQHYTSFFYNYKQILGTPPSDGTPSYTYVPGLTKKYY